MDTALPAPRRRRNCVTHVAVPCAVVALAAACGDSGPVSPGAGTTFSGVWAGFDGSAVRHGTITLSGVAAGSTVSGAIVFVGGSTIPLTGSMQGSAVSATGAAVDLTGLVQGDVILGSVGSSGKFALLSESGSTPTRYCGAYTEVGVGSPTGSSQWRWDMVRRGSAVAGAFARNAFFSAEAFTGVIAGSAISLTLPTGTGTGTLSGKEMSGSWSTPAASGTWSVSSTGCS